MQFHIYLRNGSFQWSLHSLDRSSLGALFQTALSVYLHCLKYLHVASDISQTFIDIPI
jgi:hypothetical protein